MNFHSKATFLFLATFIFSCSSPKIKISHDFDRGSIGTLIEEKPGYFKGETKQWLKRDSIGDQRYWFYFRADHVKDKSITFELNELVGVYRENPHVVYTDYTQPVFSYDQENWERIENVKYDSLGQSFHFSHQFKKEPVWIAYAHPYPTYRLNSMFNRVKNSKYVQMENIAKTAEGRDVVLVNITDHLIPADKKATVLILAMQHAGEDAGGFMTEGLIDFLISADVEAEIARENFNYIIVPMMNPDGIFNGTSRYNMQMEDLNNIWLNDAKAQPEVSGVKKWVEAWYFHRNEIDLFIDIHNHTQRYKYNAIIFQDHEIDSLRTVMNKYWPMRIWHSEFRGSSCAYFNNKGIPNGAIELSQSHLDDGKYLTIEDYLSFGRGTGLALNEYFADRIQR